MNEKWLDLPAAERARRWDEAIQLEQDTGLTDGRCHSRCTELRDWFTRETRGLLKPEAAHNVLDLVLNRMAADAAALMNTAGGETT